MSLGYETHGAAMTFDAAKLAREFSDREPYNTKDSYRKALAAELQRAYDDGLERAEIIVAACDVPMSIQKRGAIRDAIARERKQREGGT